MYAGHFSTFGLLGYLKYEDLESIRPPCRLTHVHRAMARYVGYQSAYIDRRSYPWELFDIHVFCGHWKKLDIYD
jgi:hypothetical protein